MAKKTENAVTEQKAKNESTETTKAKNEITEATKAKKDAYKKIMDYLTKETHDLPAEILEAAKIVRPSYFGLGNIGDRESDGLNPAYRQLKQLLPGGIEPGLTFTLDDAFTALRFGSREVHKMVRNLIKYPCEASPIVWVKENVDTEEYTVVAIQNEVPEGWTADLPVTYGRNFASETEE